MEEERGEKDVVVATEEALWIVPNAIGVPSSVDRGVVLTGRGLNTLPSKRSQRILCSQ